MIKNIAFIKPGSVTEPNKRKLEGAGFTVIETKDLYGFNFKNFEEPPQKPWTYALSLTWTTCANCGERIYLSTERIEALKKSKSTFYCTHGHAQNYK